MLDREDIGFKDQLERFINQLLRGNNEKMGLYEALKSQPTWEGFQRAAGRIDALEMILKEIEELARRMNDDEPARRQYERMMN